MSKYVVQEGKMVKVDEKIKRNEIMKALDLLSRVADEIPDEDDKEAIAIEDKVNEITKLLRKIKYI